MPRAAFAAGALRDLGLPRGNIPAAAAHRHGQARRARPLPGRHKSHHGRLRQRDVGQGRFRHGGVHQDRAVEGGPGARGATPAHAHSHCRTIACRHAHTPTRRQPADAQATTSADTHGGVAARPRSSSATSSTEWSDASRTTTPRARSTSRLSAAVPSQWPPTVWTRLRAVLPPAIAPRRPQPLAAHCWPSARAVYSPAADTSSLLCTLTPRTSRRSVRHAEEE